MKILITGSEGFIGKNLIAELHNQGFHDLFLVNRETSEQVLEEYCSKAEYVFHLAGVNRPKTISEFMTGNADFTKKLVDILIKYQNTCPITITSSIQAELDNPYGESKKISEEHIIEYNDQYTTNSNIYRLPNVFGKWCNPNYNSAIATFCFNIARDISIQINNPETILNLVYIDDVIKELIANMVSPSNSSVYKSVPISYNKTLKEITNLLYFFKNSRTTLEVPNLADEFSKKLYSTYLSYLDESDFSYDLKMNVDNRGSFTEFIRTPERGQVSINISKPNITKGQHWHHTKNEKFLVVSGQGVIRFRKIDTSEIIEYFVSGDKLQVIDIPVGYTHNIENIGNTDMVTVMWVNEPFNPENPDTYYLEV